MGVVAGPGAACLRRPVLAVSVTAVLGEMPTLRRAAFRALVGGFPSSAVRALQMPSSFRTLTQWYKDRKELWRISAEGRVKIERRVPLACHWVTRKSVKGQLLKHFSWNHENCSALCHSVHVSSR